MDGKTSFKFSRREFIHLAAAATAALTIDWSRVKALAAAIEPKKDFPVVVIGGGLGGLSAAAHLAQNGFPVTLIEQHDRPGGYATSFDREQFTFEVSLHATAGARGLARMALTYCASVAHDGIPLNLATEYTEITETNNKKFPCLPCVLWLST